jgi:16S rRNA (adenine1518-N6/adenine1519-N6)-dimethyltransferase
LNHPPIAERIAASLESGCERVLEVGPGMGVLTGFLLERYPDVRAVEADRDMVAHLDAHLPGIRGRVLEADFLKVDLSKVFEEGQSFALIGNFPYNISSQIVFKMLDYRVLIPEMVGMFQREMAERIVAGPGSKTYGVISVLTQAWYKGELLFGVKPGSFTPPPKVQSSVIRLTRREDAPTDYDERLFVRLVKQSFGQRRKMLRNTLKGLFPEEVLQELRFQQRPEVLSVETFQELCREAKAFLEQNS